MPGSNRDTIILNQKDIEIIETVKKVLIGMEEEGLDAVNQLTGYLTSGEVAYITREKNLRNEMRKFSRCDVVEALLRNV